MGNNIKMNSKEIEWKGEDWIIQAQNREVGGSCTKGNELSGFSKID